MQRRSRLVILVFMALALALAAQERNNVQHVIDLTGIGYPQPPCDYMFQEDAYSKNHIEFLDSERLLVSFPADTIGCDKKQGYFPKNAPKFRSVIMDLSGKVLHSFDWQLGENIQAGPDGHILFLTGKEIRILDSDFSLLQSIPDTRPPLQIVGRSLIVDPARHGFAVRDGYPTYHVAYFAGNPAKQTQEADDCNSVRAVDGGFLCRDSSQPSHFTVHVSPSKPELDQRNISSTLQVGLHDNPDKRWVVPGWPAWISREGESISSSGRIMYFSRGCRFPITDTSGFGYFLRVIVVDTKEKRTILRKQYDINSDVVLSPDGNWFSVREQTRLTLRRL
jgi:hypothetical protein